MVQKFGICVVLIIELFMLPEVVRCFYPSQGYQPDDNYFFLDNFNDITNERIIDNYEDDNNIEFVAQGKNMSEMEKLVKSLPYSYDDNEPIGPEFWSDYYPICGHKRQSPINIDTDNLKQGTWPSRLRFNSGAIPKKTTISNTGHSAELRFDGAGENFATVTGGPLTSEYVLFNLHFHWGKNDRVGSEHTVDGVTYPIEMHAVFYDGIKYKSFFDAMDKPKGLAVVGFFGKVRAQICDEAESYPITKYLKYIQNPGTNITLNADAGFYLSDLIPNLHNRFVHYHGSLTTPPCFESVIWLIALEPLEFRKCDVAQFRTLIDSDGNQMVNNVRPTQQVRGRRVYRV